MAEVDRISSLPPGILEEILMLLPIQEAARMAVLSKIWKEMWLSLPYLKFDADFFGHMYKKCLNESTKKRKRTSVFSAGLDVINQVLLQHKGPIRRFVLHCPNESDEFRSQFDELNSLLLFVTQEGVEEIYIEFEPNEYMYRLPNCVLSCCTLKRLHLCAAIVEVKNVPCSLPNINSLCFERVQFDSSDIPDRVIGLPILNNLSFNGCVNIFGFNLTAPKLGTLTIINCYSDHEDRFLPVNLDLTSIHSLVLDAYNVQEFVYGCTGRQPQQQLPALNVQVLKLLSNEECYPFDTRSNVVDLLKMCSKLRELEIDLEVVEVVLHKKEDLPIFSEELQVGVEKHNMVQTVKLTNFTASQFDLFFIKGLLAGLPAVEEVFITMKETLESNSEIKNTHCFPCASKKAQIVFSPPFLPKP